MTHHRHVPGQPRHRGRARRPVAGRLDPLQHQRRIGASDVQHVRGRPARRACHPAPALRLGRPGRAPANDHLIFSKGHASPLLYSVFKAVGVVSEDELMTGYRRLGQRLQGHPTPVLPWVDVATGSLGQGLPDGVGIALAGKYLDRLPYRVWVLCGDSELAEGSIWEALDKAAYYRLANLVAIVDVNRLGQRGADRAWLEPGRVPPPRRGVRRPSRSSIDGHDLNAIDDALATAADAGRRPAHGDPGQDGQGQGLLRGRGQPGLARQALPRRHGRPRDRRARRHPQPGASRPAPHSVPTTDATAAPVTADAALPRYALGDKVATRKAYGDALVALGAPTRGGRAGWRGQQLHLRRRVRARLPRPVLRDVHRRAAARGRRDRPERSRLPRRSPRPSPRS